MKDLAIPALLIVIATIGLFGCTFTAGSAHFQKCYALKVPFVIVGPCLNQDSKDLAVKCLDDAVKK